MDALEIPDSVNTRMEVSFVFTRYDSIYWLSKQNDIFFYDTRQISKGQEQARFCEIFLLIVHFHNY